MRKIRTYFILSALFLMSSCNLFEDKPDKVDYHFEMDGIAYKLVGDGVEVAPKTNPSNYSKEIVIPSEMSDYGFSYEVVGIGGFAFNYSKVTSVILPETLKYLGGASFQGCSKLKSMVLPTRLERIEDSAFCTSGLESISIPSSVSYLGSYNFFSCPKLKSIIIEDSWTELITDDAPEWLMTPDRIPIKLEYVYIGRNIKPDSHDAFNLHGLDNLKKVVIGKYVTKFPTSFSSALEIVCEPIYPPLSERYCTDECYANSTLYVPTASIEKYRKDAYWGLFSDIRGTE